MKNPTMFVKIGALVLIALAPIQSQDRCSIDQSVMEMVNKTLGGYTTGPGGGTRKIYVSNVSFIDGVSKTGFLTDEGKLIDAAVRDGMKLAASSDPNIIVNDPQHTVPNTDDSVSKLSDIFFHPHLSGNEKYQKAVQDLLDPNRVDVLLTGMIIDSGQVIQVKPMGVSKPDQTIRSKDLTFANKDELFMNVSGKLALTQRAHEEVQKAVKEILTTR